MLTSCLAIANSMIFRFPNLLLQVVPLWLLGLQGLAFAQVDLPVSLPLDPPVETPAPTATSIQSSTSDTSVVQEVNQFKILGGQSSGGTEPNLIHQFQDFDLGSDDIANFIVNPDVANVISLINSVDPSVIDGLLKMTSSDPDLGISANLFLVNPAGIIFGQDAVLSLPANLTATTSSGLLFQDSYLLSIDGTVSEIALPPTGSEEMTLPDDDAAGIQTEIAEEPTINNLMGDPNGYLLLSETTTSASIDPLSPSLPAGSIENQGHLEVMPQSSITLIGQYIQNDGTLVAAGGSINLVAASGENILRLSQPDSLLSLDVIPFETVSIVSPMTEQSSTVELVATDLALLLTGGDEQSATQIETDNDGNQSLTSPPPLMPSPGSVLVRGTLDVSSHAAPEQTIGTAGQVTILGDQINLVGSTVNADAIDAAGTISIGGMPMVDGFSATYVVVDRDSELSASSSQDEGGVIEIWADDSVWFYGEATATGASSDLDGSISIDADEQVDIR